MTVYFAHTEKETIEFGRWLGDSASQFISAGVVIFLKGDLGSGKTTLCRGVLRHFGYSGAVKSPTYTIVEPYEIEFGQINHFDFFRIKHPYELDFIGINDYFLPDMLCLVEWPEKGIGAVPKVDLSVSIETDGATRKISLTPDSEIGERIFSRIKEIE